MSRKLNIGGKERAEGWEVFNIVPAPFVDHQGNASDLSRFGDETFEEIYASHVLEHFDYGKDMKAVLLEWKRVLKKGGRLYVSVPDLDTLARLILDKNRFNIDERYFIMQMMFGGHQDQYDYHCIGLNQDFLVSYLLETGYVNLRRTVDFGIFNDTSTLRFKDIPVSLNVIAEKPME